MALKTKTTKDLECMYLHIGEKTVIYEKNLICVIDLELTTVSQITKTFLAQAQKKNIIYDIAPGELPKTAVVYEKDGEVRVYISPIATLTIYKRSKWLMFKKENLI